MAGHVFVSYRSEDKAAAERVCQGLESRDIPCWMAPRNIPAGKEWATAIVEAIQAGSAFVIVLSSNSKNAKQISREAELADRQGIPIITFRIEDVEPPAGLMYFLGNIQWLDAFGGQFDSAVAQLVKLISTTPEPVKQTKTMREKSSGPELYVPTGETFGATPSRPTAASQTVAPVSYDAVPHTSFEKRKASTPWLAIGLIAALALILVLLGLLWRSHRAAEDAKDARAVAKRFLTERDSGDFDSAWSETSPDFRNSQTKAAWEKSFRAAMKQHGQPKDEFKVCKPNGGGFICEYAIKFADGANASQTLWLEKQPGGAWAIAHGAITMDR